MKNDVICASNKSQKERSITKIVSTYHYINQSIDHWFQERDNSHPPLQRNIPSVRPLRYLVKNHNKSGLRKIKPFEKWHSVNIRADVIIISRQPRRTLEDKWITIRNWQHSSSGNGTSESIQTQPHRRDRTETTGSRTANKKENHHASKFVRNETIHKTGTRYYRRTQKRQIQRNQFPFS